MTFSTCLLLSVIYYYKCKVYIFIFPLEFSMCVCWELFPCHIVSIPLSGHCYLFDICSIYAYMYKHYLLSYVTSSAGSYIVIVSICTWLLSCPLEISVCVCRVLFQCNFISISLSSHCYIFDICSINEYMYNHYFTNHKWSYLSLSLIFHLVPFVLTVLSMYGPVFFYLLYNCS